MMSAWSDDWYERIKQRVRESGFESVTEFADAQPTASLLGLADQLGEDIAAIQIEKVLIDEAEETATVERCARSLLVRRLHEKLPEGWHLEWDDSPFGSKFRRASAYATWCRPLPKYYEESCHRVWGAFVEMPIPAGWLPAGPDDPILVELFRQHWLLGDGMPGVSRPNPSEGGNR